MLLTPEQVAEMFRRNTDELIEVRFVFASEAEITDDEALVIVRRLIQKGTDVNYLTPYVIRRRIPKINESINTSASERG